MLKPKLFSIYKDYSRALFKKDLFAGVTVGIVAIPLAMAFAIASGLPPERGLFTAVIAGFLVSLLYSEYFGFIFIDLLKSKLFKSKYEIEDYIEELEEDIDNYEKDLLAYAVSDPKNIPDGDSEWAVVDAVKSKVNGTLEMYRETIIVLYKTRNYLEVFDPNKIDDDAD